MELDKSLLRELRRLNDGLEWFKEWVEEFEIGETLNELCDHAEAISKITHIEPNQNGTKIDLSGAVQAILGEVMKYASAVAAQRREK